MTWLILGIALVAVATVVVLLVKETRRWQDGSGPFSMVGSLRVVSGVLLIMVFVLVALGMVVALPREGAGAQPSPVMITYWIFIALLTGAVVFLTLLDMFLVRRGFQRQADQVLQEILGRRAQPSEPLPKPSPPQHHDQ